MMKGRRLFNKVNAGELVERNRREDRTQQVLPRRKHQMRTAGFYPIAPEGHESRGSAQSDI